MKESDNLVLSEELKDEISKIAEIFVNTEDTEKAKQEANPAIANLMERFNISQELMPEILKEFKNQIKKHLKSKISVSVSMGKGTPSRVRPTGNNIIADISDYTVIDLETTNKYPTSAEIIEMSAVRIRNSKIVDTYSTLVKPSCSVPSRVTKLTGITNEMLSDAPKIEDKFKEYIDFIDNDIVLGHNIARFDIIILYDLCKRLGLKPFSNNMLDTFRYSRYCNIDVPNHKLVTLTNFFGIKHEAHRALNDCIANFECYERLKAHFTGKYIFNPVKNNSESSLSYSVKPCYSDIAGKSIVLTGEFNGMFRDEVKELLEKLGAKVKSAVSGKTDYLIIGSLGNPNWRYGNYGDKVAKAQELQLKGKAIEIVQEEEFFE